MISAELLDVLACPRCRGDLVVNESAQALECEQCQLRYAVIDGIPNLLVEEATPLR